MKENQTVSLSETFAFVNSDNEDDDPKSIFLDIEKSSDEKHNEQEMAQRRKRKIDETMNYFNSIKKQKQNIVQPTLNDRETIIALDNDHISDLSDDDLDELKTDIQTNTTVGTKQIVQKKTSKLDQALSKLNEKKKSTISQSKQDWKQFKEKEGIEHELKQYTKDGYLEKQSFLDRTEMRQFELDKDLRNAERKRKEQQNSTK